MSNYGTWTTIDCPTKNIKEAYSFLKNKFGSIKGIVRKCENPHDFGYYPSFEIDIPKDLEDIDVDNEFMPTETLEKYNNWCEEANKIEVEFYKQFGE